MKYVKIVFLCVGISTIICADNVTHKEWVHNIEKDCDILFTQGREKLEAKEDIIQWLYSSRNNEEMRDIKNNISNMRVETCFDITEEHATKEQLKRYLQEKIQGEFEKFTATDGVTPENVEDFFCFSRVVCGVTLESNNASHEMIKSLKKENSFLIKQLKIIDKAQTKIKKIEKKRQRKELFNKLCENIIVSTDCQK